MSAYPDFMCFTFSPLQGGHYVVTIHDTEPFKGLCVAVGSHSPHSTIQINPPPGTLFGRTKYIRFRCYDCNRREKECGPHAMQHIICNGIPRVVCSDCRTKYPGYDREHEQLFWVRINIPGNASVHHQKTDRLDTFVVQTENERNRLIC